MSFQTFITETLTAASQIAKNNFGKVSSTVKTGDNNQVLTETDLEIGRHIVQAIQTSFPEHNVIDEEAGVIDNSSPFTWVVDPIDGTSNFANGLPTYGVMMGLLQENVATAGGISLPAFDQLFIAEKGFGAYCNQQKISVTNEPKLLNALIAYGIDGHQEDVGRTREEAELLGRIVLNIRNLRTTNSAYDMAQVAAGRYGAYLNQTTKIWDNVALQPIIEEAGGIVTDFWGKPMDYSNPITKASQNFTICAGSANLHQQLQSIIRNS